MCEWRITSTYGERIVLNITELVCVSPNFAKENQCSLWILSGKLLSNSRTNIKLYRIRYKEPLYCTVCIGMIR